MPIFIDKITFANRLKPAGDVNWLLGNVGDKIDIFIEISVKTFTINSTQSTWVLNNRDGYIRSTSGSIWITNGNFSEFNVGDLIKISNYASNTVIGTATILQKLSNTEIEIDSNPVGWTPQYPGTQDVFSLVRPITALTYKQNFIKNSEATNYFSKIDGSVQSYTITDLFPGLLRSNLPMTQVGAITGKIGEVLVDEMGIDTGIVYASKFKIKHATVITPIMLDIQWDDLIAGIAPEYFYNSECLKSVFNFEARYLINDPNLPQSLQSDTVLGNTGWFNENWNGGENKYYTENLQYYYIDSGSNIPISGVELSTSRRTYFEFTIRNTFSSPFINGQTKLALNFCKAPNDESEYTLNNRDILHNFVWENALLTASTAPVAINGQYYADPSIRSLANLKATFINSSTITVTGYFDFDQQAIDVFEESNEPRYLLFAAIQDSSLLGPASDRVTLLVDAKNNYYQSSFPNLIQIASRLIPHDEPSYVDSGLKDRDKFTEDELVGLSEVIIGSDPLVTSLELLKYTAKILAFNTVTGSEFVLDSTSVNLPQTSALNPTVGGSQYFDILQARPLHIPANEIRKSILAKFNAANNYMFAYPYLNRWEYWVSLLSANSVFFNTLQPNNGKNQDWRHYNITNWKARYRIELATKINDIPALYASNIDYKIFDRNLLGENTTCIINTYDPNTFAPLIDSGGTKYVLGYKNTLFRAEFTNNVDYFNDESTTVVLGIEVFEQGGHFGKRRMSSKYVSDADTWFIPLPSETKVKLTYSYINVLGVMKAFRCRAEAYLDFTFLNSPGLKYKLTARIYGQTQTIPLLNTIEYGNNYLGSQNVGLIPTNPIQEDTEVLEPKQIDCCSDLVWRVLANAANNDPLKNDVNNFIWWFDKNAVDTAVLSLVASDGTETVLTSNITYGTPYNYGFDIMPLKNTNSLNQKAVGYKINWREVLLALGEDTYYIKCSGTTIFGTSIILYSDTYCLKQYSLYRANGTVRIEYNINGILGNNDNDSTVRDYMQSNWYNQHRFDGIFHFSNAQYKVDEIQYENGLIDAVEHGQTPEYLLSLRQLAMFKHNLLRTDILMANKILVTDYNNKNIENYYQKQVTKVSGYDPKLFINQSKLGDIEIKLKQTINNLNKYIS